MTNEQWASLHMGDESYGSNEGYFCLARQIRETFGSDFFHDHDSEPHAFLFHQGRTAESMLFCALARESKGLLIPSNGHFDTTRANIEASGIEAVNLFSEALDGGGQDFAGDMDTVRLEALLEQHGARVPIVMLTITNNTGGGQPVSMRNIVEVARIAHERGKPLIIDACRFAENAWFIQQREHGYADKTVAQIVHEMFEHVDGMTISFKKDGLANMGGGLFFRKAGRLQANYPSLLAGLIDEQFAREGNPTYGGMSGRDIMALAHGLRRVLDENYLQHRTTQVAGFAKDLQTAGIPIVAPAGGHAVYLKIDEFFADTKMEPADYGGVALSVSLLAAYGHRTVELGYFSFGKYDPQTNTETFPEINYLRFAIPRLRYERQDLEAVVEAVKILHDVRDQIPPIDVVHGRELSLRSFKARLAFRDPRWMTTLRG